MVAFCADLNIDLGLLVDGLKDFGGFIKAVTPLGPERCERLEQFLAWRVLSKSCVVSEGAIVAGIDLVEPIRRWFRRAHCELLNPASVTSPKTAWEFGIDDVVCGVAKSLGCRKGPRPLLVSGPVCTTQW